MKKQKKGMKKALSMLLALAMIVTGINYTPKVVSAATDGWTEITGLQYQTDLEAMKLYYKVAQGSEQSAISRDGAHGLNIQLEGLYADSNDGLVESDTFQVYFDEGKTLEGTTHIKKITDNTVYARKSGNSYLFGLGLSVFNVQPNTYYSLRFVYDGHDVVYYFYTGENPEDTPEPGPEPDTNSSTNIQSLQPVTDEAIYGFEQTQNGYKVVFTDSNNLTDSTKFTLVQGDTVSYEIYINGTDDTHKVTTVSKSGEIISHDVIDALSLPNGTSENTVYVKAVLNRKNKEGAEETLTSMSAGASFAYKTVGNFVPDNEQKQTGLGKVFIDTMDDSAANADGALLKTNDKSKHTAVISITDNQETWEDFGTVNIRGNSTSNAHKKAYNIKFDSKKNVFGFGNAKKWSLLANALDKSLLRNQVAMNFMRKLEEGKNQYSSKCRSVDLYLDGHFMGTYLLIESVEAGEDRVDIDAENSENLEMLLEINSEGKEREAEGLLEDNYATAEADKTLAYHFTINEPERPGTGATEEKKSAWDTLYTTKREGVISHLKQFETAADVAGEGKNSDFEKISQLIDVDSFVDFYIVSELFRTEDIAYSSTRFYTKTVNGTTKLYAGPLWDLDLSSGNNSSATAPDADKHAQDMVWFKALMNNAEFKALVSRRYEAVLPLIKKIYSKDDEAVSVAEADPQDEELSIDKLAAIISKSAEANYKEAYNAWNGTADNYNVGWGISENEVAGSVQGSPTVYTSYEEAVEDFATWIENRNPYLMKQLGASDPDAGLADTDYAGMTVNRYYNLALNKKVTALNQYNRDNAAVATDGLFGSGGNNDSELLLLAAANGGNSTYGKGETWAMVDLGAYYKASDIDKIMVLYKDNAEDDTALGHPYQIQFSKNAYDWENAKTVVDESKLTEFDWAGRNNEVKTATIDEINITDGAEDMVRYIRFYYAETPTYGIQINEIAVFDTDRDAVPSEVNVPVPTITAESDENNAVNVNITANEQAEEGTTYAIFVDGVLKETVNGTGKHTITGLAAGSHEITVAAIHNGYYSELTEPVSVEVDGKLSVNQMMTDASYNLALNKDYWLSRKAASGELADSADSAEGTGSVTDGKIGTANSDYASSEFNANSAWFTIDLGALYPANVIESVYVWYRSTNEGTGKAVQQIQYSSDNKNWRTVATVNEEEFKQQKGENAPYAIETSINNNLLKVAESDESLVRYVRVYWPQQLVHGAQITEIGVFDEDQDAKVVSVFEPMSEDQITADEKLKDARWTQVEGTDFWYYDPESIRQSYSIQNGILNAGLSVAADFRSVKINGVELADSYSGKGANVNVDTARFEKNGIYGIVITDANGNLHNLYYKKDTPAVYNILGVTVTDITAESVKINWVVSEDLEKADCLYKIIIDDQTVSGDETIPIPSKSYEWKPTEGLKDGEEHTVVIEAYDAEGKLLTSTENSPTKFVYRDEPDYVDLEVTNVDVECELEVDKDATITFTVHNNGKGVNLDGASTVFKYYADPNISAGNSDMGTDYFGGNGYAHLNECTVNGLGEDNYFAYGSDFTASFHRKVKEAFLSAEKIRFGLSEEGIMTQDGNQNNDYFIWTPNNISVPQNVQIKAQNENKTLHVTWDAPEDADTEGPYKYNVYLNDSREPANGDTPIDGNSFDIIQDEAFEGKQTVTVKTVKQDNGVAQESLGVSTSTYVYTIDESKWHIWDNGTGSGDNLDESGENGNAHCKDINGNIWYYYDGYGTELGEGNFTSDLDKRNDEFAGLDNKGGHMNGTPAVELLFKTWKAWDTITINGKTYKYDVDTDVVAAQNGRQRLLLAQSLFKLNEGEISKVFEVTVSGGGQELFMLFKVVTPYTLPALEKYRASLTEDGDVIVTWDKAVDEKEGTYTYEVYVDGSPREVEVSQNSDGTKMGFRLEGLGEGRHSIETRRTLNEEYSPKAFTFRTVYREDQLKWIQWTGRTQDIDNDTWWYDANYMDGEMVSQGKISSDGTFFQFQMMNGASPLLNATSISIDGVSYNISREKTDEEGAPSLAYQETGKYEIYLSHELFPVDDNTTREKIYTVSVTGTQGGSEVTRTFLVKLVNEDYSSKDVELKHMMKQEDGTFTEPDPSDLQPNGHVIFRWKDDEHRGDEYGYQISFYNYKDTYNPNNPSENKITKVWLKPGEYEIDKDGWMAYHLTENKINIRSNTPITVTPVIGVEDGSPLADVEEIGFAVGQAELAFYGDPTTVAGAYVRDTPPSQLLFRVINIGTAPAATKLAITNNNLDVRLTEYKDAEHNEVIGAVKTFQYDLTKEGILPGEYIEAKYDYTFKDRNIHYFEAEIDPNNDIYEQDQDENNRQFFEIIALYEGSLKILWDKDQNIYTAQFAPRKDLFEGGGDISGGDKVSAFEFEYYDHGVVKKCRVSNKDISRKGNAEEGYYYEVQLPREGENKVEHIDSDTYVTIAIVSTKEDGGEEYVGVFADDKPFWQETEMDWTPIPGGEDGGPFDFKIPAGTVNVEYKVLYANDYYANYHYRDIASAGNGYGGTWNTMSIVNSDYIGKKYESEKYPIDKDGNGGYFTTILRFAQVTRDYCENYGTSSFKPDYQTQIPENSVVKIGDDFIESTPGQVSPIVYNGAGFNFNYVNCGLGKYYALQIEGTEGQQLVLACRIISTEEEQDWFRINPANGNPLSDFYYHSLQNKIEGTYYYDVSDWYLSAISSYNSTYISITTDPARRLNTVEEDGHQKWKVLVAEAEADAQGRAIEPQDLDAYRTYWGYASGTEGVTIIAAQNGDNINFAMSEMIKQFPAHSGKAGVQNFYYWMRIYTDTEKAPNEYISAPIRIRADVPKIDPLPEENINVSSGSKNLYVSFAETEAGTKNDYVYDIYLDDALVASQTDLKDGKRVPIPVPSEKQGKLNEIGSEFKIKIVSKWCYSADKSDTEHWYADGSGELVNHYQSTETTYIYENEIDVGEVYVQGFQMNTNKEEGGISEFMPSMRVVSKAAERIKKNGTDNTAYGVVSYGTIIAPSSGGAELNELSWSNQQDIEDASGDGSLAVVEASTSLKWTGADADMYNYYGVSLKNLLYKYSELETKYQFRAYAVLDDDESTVVLSENTYEVDLFEVAQNLYENHQMGTKEGHEFLYDDILNIVAIHKNYLNITYAMLTALKVPDTVSPDYQLINKVYKDLYYYTEGSGGYTYQNRIETAEDGTVTKFVSKHLTDEENTELLEKLNEVSDANNGEVGKQATLYDWIEANVGTLKGDTMDLTIYEGFYQTLDYQWDDNLYKVGSPVSGNSE